MSEQVKDNEGQVDKTPDGDPVVRSVGREFRVDGNDVDGYIGVDSEYRTYAQPTDRPYVTDADVVLLEKGGTPTDVERMTLDAARQAKRDQPKEKLPQRRRPAAAKAAPAKQPAKADTGKSES